jgi:hypothetical protein
MGDTFIYDKNKNAIKTDTGIAGATKLTPIEEEILTAIKLLEKRLECIELPAKENKKERSSKRRS